MSQSPSTILVVEDDRSIRLGLEDTLRAKGYLVHSTACGFQAVELMPSVRPDLVVLDIMLPDIEGFEVCRRIKALSPHQAVIMLTARSSELDRVRGLEIGADDYITKPFSPRVVSARVKAVLRRKRAEPVSEEQTIRIRDLIIHPGRREVLVKGQAVDLTFTEFSVLHTLARRPGWVFTRSQIVDAIRGYNYAVTDRSVDVQIVGLRRKLGPCGRYIQTVRGVGYRFRDQNGHN